MEQYHKIQTIFKRDPDTNMKTLLMGEFSTPEFAYLRQNQWEFTEKVDGMNIRIMWDGTQRRFQGKTDNSQIPSTLIAILEDMFPPEKFLAVPEFNEPGEDGQIRICLYGEGYGSRIQSGGNYRQDQSFVLFDVKVDVWWLMRPNVLDVAKKMGIDFVPAIGIGTLDDMVDLVAPGFTSQWGDFRAEGVVARPLVSLFDRGGRRVITKLKCKDFR